MSTTCRENGCTVQPKLLRKLLLARDVSLELANPDRDAGYYALIEAIWTLHKSSDRTTIFNILVHVSSIFYVAQSRRVGGGSWKLWEIYEVEKLSLFTDSPLARKTDTCALLKVRIVSNMVGSCDNID